MILIVLVLAGEAKALTTYAGTDKVEVTVTTSVDEIGNNAELDVIFTFRHMDGWHTYWKYAGEGGMGTRVTGDGIQGTEFVYVNQSRPIKFYYEGFEQFGYNDIAYFKYRIGTLDKCPGIAVKGTVHWLACKDECFPEEADFDLMVPCSFGESVAEPAWEELNIKALSTFPTKYEENAIIHGVDYGFWMILFMAFAGGLILNLMPCVLPILSLKAIGLVQSKQKNHVEEAGMYFTGVVSSFMIVAGLLAMLKANGENIGWGFQLQSPVFVTVMIAVFFAIFLMLMDWLPIRNPFINHVGRISFKQQRVNAFFTGFFAVIIASPCTAPFMGIAIGYTIMQPSYVYFPVFIALSVGYALPFTLVTLYPQVLGKWLPKPGKWMLILKKVFAIPVFLTCVWLGWVLYAQIKPEAASDLNWKVYDKDEVDALIEDFEPVFVDFTAKWCITCLANEKFVLETEAFAELVKERNIHLYKADWTSKDEKVTEALADHGRASIPLYLYHDGFEVKILPQILTTSIVKEYLE